MRKLKDGDKVYMTKRGKIAESKQHLNETFTVIGKVNNIGGIDCVFLKELNKPYECDELRLVKE